MPEPEWQEPLEQAAHFALGFVAGLIFGLLLIWWREWVEQWPPGKPMFVEDSHAPGGDFVPAQWHTQLSRVEDTKTDLFWFDAGYTLGQIVQVGLVWRYL